ncbi:methyltransferase [Roseibium sp. RKSG952]|nr:methyltransferase [Roseibium sp. RKSG952]
MSDPVAFIKAETQVKPVAHAEEIRLHQADEAMVLWQKTEDELGALGLPPPFWAFAWAGGQALARYVLDTPELVRGKRILDFASGSGLVGIACMKSRATACLCVDIDPFAKCAGELNADLNSVSLTYLCEDMLDAPVPDVDVLFCGDVFYDKPMADKVLAFLDKALASGLEVYVGDPGRSYLPKDRLTRLAHFTVPVIGALEDADVKNTAVFQLNSKG